jgi:hypothetical protein
MSIAEIIQAVQCRSRGEKFYLAHILLEDLVREELPTLFKDGQSYTIYRPEYAPGATAQLAQLLGEEGASSWALVRRGAFGPVDRAARSLSFGCSG